MSDARCQMPATERGPLGGYYLRLEALKRLAPKRYITGHFVIRRAKISYLDNQKASEKIQHMAEKLSLRYVEIRGLF